jgi:hypothetical protein
MYPGCNKQCKDLNNWYFTPLKCKCKASAQTLCDEDRSLKYNDLRKKKKGKKIATVMN